MTKTYIIPVIKTVSGYIAIEASSESEAIELANNMPDIDDKMDISDSDIEVIVSEIEEQ